MIDKYTIVPPFTQHVGQSFRRRGRIFEQWLGGVKIDQRNLDEMASAPVVEFDLVGGGAEISVLYLERQMAGVVATIVDLVLNPSTGSVTAKFSDGDNQEYGSFTEMKEDVEPLDTETTTAKKLLLNKLVRLSPDGSNLDVLNGSSCTIDGNAATPVQFSLTV